MRGGVLPEKQANQLKDSVLYNGWESGYGSWGPPSAGGTKQSPMGLAVDDVPYTFGVALLESLHGIIGLEDIFFEGICC